MSDLTKRLDEIEWLAIEADTEPVDMPDLAVESSLNVHPLLAAVRAVLELHKPFEWTFGYGPVKSCKHCADIGASEGQSQWPCPTAQAIYDAMGEGR